NTLDALTWKLDEQAEQKLNVESAPANEFTVPLQLERGVHRVRVVARTPEAGRREFVQELRLRYQPPPPEIAGKTPSALTVQEPAFTLEAEIRAAKPEEAVHVDLAQQHGSQSILRESKTYPLNAGQPLAFRKQVTLRPGSNLIEILARNPGALLGHEEA